MSGPVPSGPLVTVPVTGVEFTPIARVLPLMREMPPLKLLFGLERVSMPLPAVTSPPLLIGPLKVRPPVFMVTVGEEPPKLMALVMVWRPVLLLVMPPPSVMLLP